MIEAPAPVQIPKERPRTAPAALSPASRALVTQAQAQRKKGDLPGASVSLDRALRIEPNNPLLWIEMGRLRMDQRNYPQAENMGRKGLAMAVGDDSTQALAWQLIGEALRAQGKNPQGQAIRTRSHKLLFVTLERDRAISCGAFGDYLIKFFAPGENETPNESTETTREQWIEWAEPVWHIRETRTLNVSDSTVKKMTEKAGCIGTP